MRSTYAPRTERLAVTGQAYDLTTRPDSHQGGSVATATAAPTTTPTLLDTIMEIKRELMQRVVNRTREIDALLTALIAGQHIFLLGTPGIGKSMLIDLLVQCIDAQDFSILMTKFTVLEDLYGPL